MKIKMKSYVIKVMMGSFLFALFLLGNFNIVRANSVSNNLNSDTIVTDGEDVNVEAIMSAIAGRNITDGDSFVVDNTYQFDCDVSIESAANSGISIDSTSNNVANSTEYSAANSSISSTTNSYTATCTVYVTSLFSQTHVATIYHSVNITYSDSGLVHINSGSLSVYPCVSWFSGYAYGYSINNTNGSYSSASGMVELYNSLDKVYNYYGSTASVSQGNSPTFSFTQV